MELGSGRRPASPPAPRGGVCPARPKRSHADGEDRISDLPKELRLEVLLRLGCAREAARTSVLSRPWRGLWTELRDLNFDGVGDPDSLGAALATVRPDLDRLRISDNRCAYAPSRISSLLRAADRLAPVELDVTLRQKYSYYSNGPPSEIPCFQRATSIDLCIHGLSGMLPLAGQFAALEQLSLGKGFLNPGVLVHRCPRLRKLDMEMYCPREFYRLTVESKSLEELTWWILEARRPEVVRIVVVAPELKKFRLFFHSSGEFTVSLSAPKLEEFHLEYKCVYSRVRSAQKWRLCELKMATEWSSRHGAGQLQNVRVHVLSLTILNDMKNLPAKRSIEQEVARLPVTDFSVLELCLGTEGHVFGALVLQLLRIRTTIQRLKVLRLKDKFPNRCSEDCDCDEANWRNEPLSLLDLEVVEFEGLRGEDHELDFLHLLFGSAPMMKRMRVELFDEDSLATGACQKLQSIFAANASVECSVHAKSGW